MTRAERNDLYTKRRDEMIPLAEQNAERQRRSIGKEKCAVTFDKFFLSNMALLCEGF